MNRFQVIQPSVLLAPYVKQYWFLKMENKLPCVQRLVPFGCVALTFHRGNRTFSSVMGNYMPSSHLYGINTQYTNLIFSGPIDFISIIFQPAGAGRFFNVPLGELKNNFVSMPDLEDPALLTLENNYLT